MSPVAVAIMGKTGGQRRRFLFVGFITLMRTPATLLLTAVSLLLVADTCRAQRRGMERMMQQWDRNGDGYVTKDEAPERAWGFLLRRAEAAGIKPGDKLKIADFASSSRDPEDRRESDRGRNAGDRNASGGRASRPSTADFARDQKVTKVRGFAEQARREPRERSDRAGSPSSAFRERAERYAKGLFERYDRNKNRILEREEWKRMRGEPENADANGDGVLTLEELTNRLENNYRSRDREERREGRDEAPRERREASRRGEDAAEQRKSYRFTPAHERLPKGLPRWFEDRDTNLDGQVAMHEFSAVWTDRKAAEFKRYDKNGDGMLTSDEMVGER